MWICNIGIKDDNTKEMVEIVCQDTALKDDTFKYAFLRCRYGQFRWILQIGSQSKDQAHQRGRWFQKKVFGEDKKVWYWVKKTG